MNCGAGTAARFNVVTTVRKSSCGTSGSAVTSATASGIAVMATSPSVFNACALPASAMHSANSTGSLFFIGTSAVVRVQGANRYAPAERAEQDEGALIQESHPDLERARDVIGVRAEDAAEIHVGQIGDRDAPRDVVEDVEDVEAEDDGVAQQVEVFGETEIHLFAAVGEVAVAADEVIDAVERRGAAESAGGQLRRRVAGIVDVPPAGVLRVDGDRTLVGDAVEVDVDRAGVGDRERRARREAQHRRQLQAAEQRFHPVVAVAEERG